MCQKITKYSIYVLVFLLPLFWLPFTFEPFEFNKGYLLFLLVSVGLLAWFAKMIFEDKQITFRRTKLDFMVLGFSAVMILAAVFSKDKATSIYGFYGRFWPSLVGMLSLAGFYFLLTNNVSAVKEKETASAGAPQNKPRRPLTLNDLLRPFLVSSGLVAISAYLSIFNIWQMLSAKLPVLVFSRAFNPAAGSLEALSMFLAFAVMLAVGSLVCSLRRPAGARTATASKAAALGWKIFEGFLLALALGLLAIIDFWPAWFALGVSLFLFLFFAFWKRLFKENVNCLTLPIFLFFLALLFIFSNPLDGLLGQVGLADLPAEVFLRQNPSWRLALQSFRGNPVLGSGLGNFAYAFSKYRPATFLENNPLWYLRLDRGGNHIAEWAATTGVLGVLAYFGLFGLFLFFAYRMLAALSARQSGPTERHILPLIFAFLTLLVGQFVYYQSTVLAFSLWLMLGLSATVMAGLRESPKEAAAKTEAGPAGQGGAKTFSFKSFPEIGLVFGIIFWVLLAGFAFFSFKLAQNYRADIYYRQYLQNPFRNIDNLKKAAQISSNDSVYHLALAQAYLADFSGELKQTQPDPQTLNNMVALAVGESRKAAEISPYRVAAYETSGIIYRDIQGVAQGAVDWAIKSFEKALELEPRNPAFLTELGKLYLAKGDQDKAAQVFEQAIAVKSDYVDAYLQMARLEETREQKEAAMARLQTAVEKNPASVEGHFQLGRFYYNSGELDKAEEQFSAALQLFPNHSNSLYSLALLYERRGQTSKALAAFERVLELNPGNADVIAKVQALRQSGGE